MLVTFGRAPAAGRRAFLGVASVDLVTLPGGTDVDAGAGYTGFALDFADLVLATGVVMVTSL